MLAFILRRLLQAVIVMLTVAFIAFMLFQYVGDPVTSLLGQDATQEMCIRDRSCCARANTVSGSWLFSSMCTCLLYTSRCV